MAYVFGENSRKELAGVDERLVAVATLALDKSFQNYQVDFGVHDGIRTLSEQRHYVATGVSKTMHSKHLEGRAVDLVPYINGKLRWEWGPIYKIAAAMLLAARELNVTIRWGGSWDRNLNDLAAGINDPGTLPAALERAVHAYADRHPGPDFLDGPHFEIVG